jgi:hypothetical protein
MKLERVRFASHPQPFRVVASQCTNPACACSVVTFDLVEVLEAGQPAQTRLRLEIRVDPETWEEVQVPERPGAWGSLIQEFLRDYPAAERQLFREAAQKKQKMAQRLRDYRFDAEALAGRRLVAFDEVVSEPDSTDGPEFLGRLEQGDRTYLIRDLYCANPQCPCSEVKLEFLLYTPPSRPEGHAVAEPRFLACVSLAGKVQVEKPIAEVDAQVAARVAVWWEENREVLADLRWRYDKIKEIGRRSMPVGRVSAVEAPRSRPTQVTHGRPGRNDPCPCGSGKKYKKCCGR